ncbi:MAG: hypothetical protein KME12_23435 [Trichocoleus desertorum ATA4-8-CV12]|jgi:hypothetical protein|nr:hypothetical protein [Trichocoleus desertorum ATA4-8-CV12]
MPQTLVVENTSAIAPSTTPSQSGEDERGSGRIYCTHPNAIKYPEHTYRAIAQITHKSGKQATADVVVLNPCLAAIDKCLDVVLGTGWHTTQYQWCDAPF